MGPCYPQHCLTVLYFNYFVIKCCVKFRIFPRKNVYSQMY